MGLIPHTLCLAGILKSRPVRLKILRGYPRLVGVTGFSSLPNVCILVNAGMWPSMGQNNNAFTDTVKEPYHAKNKFIVDSFVRYHCLK
jgi:hypothetical protein